MNSVQELRAAVSPPSAPTNTTKTPAKSRSFLIALVLSAAVLGICAGVAIDRLVLPHGVTPPPAAVEVPGGISRTDPLATGTFIQPDANNPLYRGAGGVSVYNREVVLAADFAVTPGPDFRVLLVPKPAIRAAADISNTMYVDLGPLAVFKGSQHYAVPAGVDLANYPSVVIWCRTYGALISSADLSFAKSGG